MNEADHFITHSVERIGVYDTVKQGTGDWLIEKIDIRRQGVL